MLIRNGILLGRLLRNVNSIKPIDVLTSLSRPVAASKSTYTRRFPPDKYVPAITEPEELDKIISDKDERERIQFINIHPAWPCQNISLFNHPTVIKLSSYIMKEGNRALARKLLEQTFEFVKKTQLAAYYAAESEEEREQIVCDPLQVCLSAIENARPTVELYPVRKGGITYKVPVPMTEKHSYFIAMRWLVHAGRDRKIRRMHFPENFARELVDAHNNTGRVIQQKKEQHQECEANRAYAHYRWG